jgi:sulfur carrier protein
MPHCSRYTLATGGVKQAFKLAFRVDDERSAPWHPGTLAPWHPGTLALMMITLNGDPHELQAPLTVTELLQQLQIDPRRVAVELNLVVLKRTTFESTVIHDGDEVEIVNFVGGG